MLIYARNVVKIKNERNLWLLNPCHTVPSEVQNENTQFIEKQSKMFPMQKGYHTRQFFLGS
jgi:starvation-inducible outer membrane lipoprotein